LSCCCLAIVVIGFVTPATASVSTSSSSSGGDDDFDFAAIGGGHTSAFARLQHTRNQARYHYAQEQEQQQQQRRANSRDVDSLTEAEEIAYASLARRERVERYARKMMACSGVQSPGFMIVGVTGASNLTLFADSEGKASLSPSITAAPSTQWAIGSATKSLTAVLIGQLVDQGLLAWNTRVDSILEGFATNSSDPVTIRDLLSMVSGVPRNDIAWFAGRAGNLTEMSLNFKYLKPSAAFRQTFWYNNFGYAFLGLVFEKKTGMSWEQGIAQRIFAPLGMTSSAATAAQSIASGKYAYPHVIDTNGISVNVLPFDLNVATVDQVGAAGSIALTAGDAAKYLKAMLSPTMDGLLSEASANFLHKAGVTSLALHDGSSDYLINFANDPYQPLPYQMIAYGGGWMHGLYRNKHFIAHNGGTLGQSSWLFVFPEDDLAFGMVSNMDALAGMGRYMWDWALYARDQYVSINPDSDERTCGMSVRTSSICARFNAKTGGPSLASVDNSYITDYQLTGAFDIAYIQSIVGVYNHPFYGNASVTATSATSAQLAFGTLNGPLMTGPFTGNMFFTSPFFYQVQGLAAGFGAFHPSSGKAQQVQFGIENPDPIFLRVD
jgi:CubicO group peptidase (beta-lactamase class C family)